MKALILENSRLYRQLLDNILGQQGFENDITDEIRIARDYLSHADYDVICLNDILKDGSGIEFAGFCKNDPKLKSIPILFFTSNKKLEKDLEAIGVEAVVQKNNLQQINDQITHFLEKHLDPLFFEGRILLVEDSSSLSQMILRALEQSSYRVENFTSAEKAWAEFKQEASFGSDYDAYDLIITDINLEGKMSGVDLTHQVRQVDDARGFIPIIAVTGETDAKLRLSLYQEGISDFIQKPILIDEMLVRVSNLITNKRLLDKVHDQRRELYALATTDKLTGCHNRHSLMSYSSKFISQAVRHQIPIGLMVIDLDHFKKINDTHGHAIGDVVLSSVGQLLNQCFRDEDLVARFGGEEFVVLLNHCDRQQLLNKAENLRQKINTLKPNDLQISASIGISYLEVGQKMDFEQMFGLADEAVYKAKENGRNRVETSPVHSD